MPSQELNDLRRLHRSLTMLSDVNHAIVRTRELPTLLDRVCRIAVEGGAYLGAWISLIDMPHRRVFAVAAAGQTDALIAQMDAAQRDEVNRGFSLPEPYASGRRFVCNDVESDHAAAAWREVALAIGCHAFAALPLMAGDEVRGALNVCAPVPDVFDAGEIDLLDKMASEVGFALSVFEQEEQRRSVEQTLARYTKRLEILHQIDAGIISAQSIDEVVRTTLEHLRVLVPYDRARVGLLGPSGETFHVLVTEEHPEGTVMRGDALPVVPGMWDEFDGRDTRIVDLRARAAENPGYMRLIDEGLATGLQVRLVAPNGVIGILGLGSAQPDAYTAEHEEIAAEVGSQLAITLRHMQMSEEAANYIASLKAADAALVREERRYRSVVEDQTELICRYDTDFRLTFVNRAYAEARGLTAEEMVGTSFLDRIPPEDRERAIAHVKSLTPEHPVATSEHQTILGNGVARWLQWTDRALFDDEGNIVEYQGVGRDITERKEVEAALRQAQGELEQRVADRTAELELRAGEDRLFQQYLRELHDITIELTQVDTLESFFYRAVQLGRDRLGFDRLAIILYDAEQNIATGTFGTDMSGKVNDEHDVRFTPDPTGVMMRSYRREEHFAFDDDGDLYTAAVKDGRGWKAAAVLWNGIERLGWLAADNGIRHEPASKAQLDILALYGLTIGTLLGRKKTDTALAEQRAFLQQIIDASPSMIFVKDYDSRFVLANPMVAKIYNTTPENLIGKNDSDFDLLLSEVEHFRQSDRNVIDSGQPLHLEEPITGPSGETRWLQTTKVPVVSADGQSRFVLGISTDITERKQNERSIRDALERERELGELKSRFVSMASHEFRTPLATILALTETLLAYRKRMDDAAVDERLEKIREQVDHLRDIMEDMLQLARMQARRAEFIPTVLDFDALCRGVFDEYQSNTDMRHTLVYHCDEALRQVVVDKKLMRQIVSNLLSNAIKYSALGTTITINAVKEGDELVMSVRDEGIGIPDADIKHLFDPFHRAANVGTISGTGLGLTIIKESVELHGGTVYVESRLGEGATFTMRIPLRQREDIV